MKVKKKEDVRKFNEARALGATDIAAAFYADGKITLAEIQKKFGK